MIAHRVEESIGVRGDPARAVSDRLAEAAARSARGKLLNQTAVGVHVGGRIDFERLGRAFDGYTGGLRCKRQYGLHLHGHGASDVDILRELAKTRGFYLQVITVRGRFPSRKTPVASEVAICVYPVTTL